MQGQPHPNSTQSGRWAVRQEIALQLARQLGVVASKRVSPVLAIIGKPGIGKSHLAQSILEQVPCHRLCVAATIGLGNLARSLPRTRTMPAWAKAQLARLEHDEHVETGILAQAVATILAASAPFVLCLEDVHEADPECSNWISTLASAVARLRGVGLIATSRTVLPEPFQNHRLEPLSPAETARLLEAELRVVAPSQALDWVFAQTRGNPLFTLEYSRYLRRQGFLWSDGEHWHWREPPEGFVPVTVEALILELASGLTADLNCRAALQARTVLPAATEAAWLETVWAQVANLDLPAFRNARIALERGGLFDGDGFAHPLMAEVVARHIDGRTRAEYTLRAMTALEGIDPMLAVEYIGKTDLRASERADRFERAARSLQANNQLDRAARLLARAAEALGSEHGAGLALEAAGHLIDRDVREAERIARLALGHASTRREATFLCATALERLGRHKDAWTLLEMLSEHDRQGLEWWALLIQLRVNSRRNHDAVRLWDEHPEFHNRVPVEAARAAITALIGIGEIERASRLIESVLERFDLSAAQRARLLDRRNMILYRDARYQDVEANLNAILASIDETTHPRECVSYYAIRSNVRTRLHRYAEARSDAERACKLHLATGELTGYAGLAVKLSLAQIYLGEFEQAERVLLETITLARGHDPVGLYECYGHLSFLYLRWQSPHSRMLARRYARLSLEEARHIERDDATVAALEDCCRAEFMNEDPASALEYAREIECIALRTQLGEDLTAANCQVGRALAHLGRDEEARPYLQLAAALYDEHGNHNEALNALLEIDRLEGNLEAAQAKLEWFKANGSPHYADKVRYYFPVLAATPTPPSVIGPAPCRINVLGPVTLERDGQPVLTRAQKRLEILAYLLETRIAGRSEASTLDLLDALYPGESEPEARNTLKQQVYLIRSSLGADSIISTPSGYALGKVSSDAEDVLTFDQTTLWRGPYLGGIGNGWYAGATDALSLRLRSSITALLESDPVEAVRLGSILLEMEPYDADVLRLAVQTLEAAGNPKAARRTREAGRARLAEIGMAFDEANPSPNAA
jgi:tetratricopeptide (TPR) repeat protein